jgi:hypothetical protein
LFTYLHLAPDREQTLRLLERGVTAIAYETVVGKDGGLPLLALAFCWAALPGLKPARLSSLVAAR